MKRTIQLRRGAGRNESVGIFGLAWWKYLFLFALVVLVAMLIRLNYQLMKELSHDDDHNAATDASGGGGKLPTIRESSNGGNDAKKLKQLREQVSGMKEKLDGMNQMVQDLKKKKNKNKNKDNGVSKAAVNTANAANVKYNVGGTTDNVQKESKINAQGHLERITCNSDMAKLQQDRMNKRFVEWWSHSACPDQVWMEGISSVFDAASASAQGGVHHTNDPYLILDIGCNKGYTSADFLDALSPGTNMNPNTLVSAIRSIAKEDSVEYDRDCGVCNDCKKPLNEDTKTKRKVEVHCFEPSPATYQMLVRAHEKLMPKDEKGTSENNAAKWHIHNVGLHEINGQLSWHSACDSAVGDELCTIVPEGTPDAITVPVVTVDAFLKETYLTNNNNDNNKNDNSQMPLVHMLKIDAEGLDPAVITGSNTLLTQNRAIMVMFEFNPQLSEKEHPHGMWGKNGNPHKTLLGVTDELDAHGYDCYLDTRVPQGKELKDEKVLGAPGLYRITGGCLSQEPKVRGWANVVCASRKFGHVAERLLRLSWVS